MTAAPSNLLHCQHPIGYRYGQKGRDHKGYVTNDWTPIPKAVYCWAAGQFDDGRHIQGEGLTLLHMQGPLGFIRKALWHLAQYICQHFHRHEQMGTFRTLAWYHGRDKER